jgi:hypothetical protein
MSRKDGDIPKKSAFCYLAIFQLANVLRQSSIPAPTFCPRSVGPQASVNSAATWVKRFEGILFMSPVWAESVGK